MCRSATTCRLGNTRQSLVVSLSPVARIGKRCTVGGTSAISGHLEITDDVHLTGGTNVPNSIKEPGIYSSTLPLQSNRDWRRNMARVKHLMSWRDAYGSSKTRSKTL